MVFEVKSQTHQRHLVQTKPCAHQDPGKGAVTSTGYWTQTYLWVFECLMRRHRSAVTSCRDRSSGCSRPGWHGLWREVLLGEVTVSATIKLSSRQPTNWIIIIPKKFSHYCKSSRTHKQISQPGILQRDWEPPGNLTWKASGIWLQNFQRTGKIDSWRAQQNLVHTVTQEKGAVTPQET